jgi:glycosyltransferase involved in cell wall biosynthesis
MMVKPVISTIIPVHNGEKYLADAIESALDQTFRSQEIILVDDGSTDSTVRVVEKYLPRIKYCFQSNGGTASARNRGVAMATGDDLWNENKLALQMAAFRSEPELHIAFGHLQQFHSPELTEESKRRRFCAPEPIPGVLASTMLVSREAFFHIGEFDMSWQLGEWSDWYIQAVESGLNIKLLPEVLAYRRLHENNKGTVQRQFMREYPRMLKASLDRRRANSA